MPSTVSIVTSSDTPSVVHVQPCWFQDIPVTIGIACVDRRDVTHPWRFPICRLDIGQSPNDGAEAVADWGVEWPRTRFIRGDSHMLLPDNLADFPTHVWLSGTKFQRAVWHLLLTIPQGKTMTYGDIAARLGKPAAARAVGLACGANPVPLIVPCHRVVSAGGKIGGYSGRGGPAFKAELLRREAQNIA